MSVQRKRKNIRFISKVSLYQWQLLDRAAYLSVHKSVASFMLAVAEEEALKVMHKHTTMSLSEKDSTLLLEALANPRKPNEALVQAYKRYSENMDKLFEME